MKKLLLLAGMGLMCSVQAAAQSDTSGFSISKILELNAGKDTLYRTAENFLKTDPGNMLFFTNEKIKKKDREWALGRAKVLDPDFKQPGLEAKIEEKTALVAKSVFCYKVGKGLPIEFLTIQADVIVMCKDNRVKIEFTHFKYTSKNLGAPPMYRQIIGPGGELCANAGKYEDLMKCKASPMAVEGIDRFVKTAVDKYTEELSLYLKGGIPGNYKGALNENW